MKKKMTKAEMKKLAKEFIKWYVHEWQYPSVETKQVPYIIEIHYDKKTGEENSVVVIGEKAIARYEKRKKREEAKAQLIHK
jgi:hypothetical protein